MEDGRDSQIMNRNPQQQAEINHRNDRSRESSISGDDRDGIPLTKAAEDDRMSTAPAEDTDFIADQRRFDDPMVWFRKENNLKDDMDFEKLNEEYPEIAVGLFKVAQEPFREMREILRGQERQTRQLLDEKRNAHRKEKDTELEACKAQLAKANLDKEKYREKLNCAKEGLKEMRDRQLDKIIQAIDE